MVLAEPVSLHCSTIGGFFNNIGALRRRLKCLIKKVKKSGGEGGIQTHERDALNQEVRKIYAFAVPCNPLASPDFAVDLAIAANSPFRTRCSH
jgi:hypothetical protein